MYDVVLALFDVEFGCGGLDDGKLDFLDFGDQAFVLDGAVDDCSGVKELVAVVRVVGVVSTDGICFFVPLEVCFDV